MEMEPFHLAPQFVGFACVNLDNEYYDDSHSDRVREVEKEPFWVLFLLLASGGGILVGRRFWRSEMVAPYIPPLQSPLP